MPTTKIRTKAKLVDIARQIFAKQGLENTTMNDIALASGKGRRTLYTYFKNKEEIYVSVIEAEMDRLTVRMKQVAEQELDLEEKLAMLIYTHLTLIKDAVQRNGNLRAEFFRNVFLVSKVRKNFDHNELSLITEILEQGVAQGIFQIHNIPLVAEIIHYSVRGLEIPYIYGRLSAGGGSKDNKGIVQELLHNALTRRE